MQGERIHSDVPIPCAPYPGTAPDLTGLRAGRLVVIGYHSRRKASGRMWVVRCMCGAYEVRRGSLLSADRAPDLDELMCESCEALRNIQQRARAAVTGKWPSGKPVASSLGLNVRRTASVDAGTTLKDLGALGARPNPGARQ